MEGGGQLDDRELPYSRDQIIMEQDHESIQVGLVNILPFYFPSNMSPLIFDDVAIGRGIGRFAPC